MNLQRYDISLSRRKPGKISGIKSARQHFSGTNVSFFVVTMRRHVSGRDKQVKSITI